MKIQRIKVKNFKALQNVDLKDIPNLCVLVGANGSGKTTFFDIFGFLKDALRTNITEAFEARHGFENVITKGKENENIEFDLTFHDRLEEKDIEIKYYLKIGKHEDKLAIINERLEAIIEKDSIENNIPFEVIGVNDCFDIISKANHAQNINIGKKINSNVSIINVFGENKDFNVTTKVKEYIENWHFCDVDIDAINGRNPSNKDNYLSRSADNIAIIARKMQKNHPDSFSKVLKQMRKLIPGIENIEALATEYGEVLLKFNDGAFKNPFLGRYVSDGTMKMFAYLILLHDPSPHPLLCIEEPENQLYPHLLSELVSEFDEYCSRGGQVIISTHSPDLLNNIELENLLLLKKEKGLTQITHAKYDNVIKSLCDAGDKLGYLWQQNFFDGVNKI
jgi:predicted ATPase